MPTQRQSEAQAFLASIQDGEREVRDRTAHWEECGGPGPQTIPQHLQDTWKQSFIDMVYAHRSVEREYTDAARWLGIPAGDKGRIVRRLQRAGGLLRENS